MQSNASATDLSTCKPPPLRAHKLRLLFLFTIILLSAFASLRHIFRSNTKISLFERMHAHAKRLRVNVTLHNHTHRREAFHAISETDAWNSHETRGAGSTLAGPGSTLPYTAPVRAWLGGVLSTWRIRSIADMSCSELAWQMHIPGFFDLEAFTGFDIVPSLVQRAAKAAADAAIVRQTTGLSAPRFTFSSADMVSDPTFPPHDLVILRDTLMHLPIADALLALARIDASGSKWLVTTTFNNSDSGASNEFIQPGSWFPVDLLESPFFFPPPISVTLEGLPGTDRYGKKMLGLWRLPVLGGP